MKFIITRTSNHSGERPCREAKMELLNGYSDCTCKTVAQALKIDWVKNGVPKQMDGFVRVYDTEKTRVWTIDINTLEELIKLYERHGDIIIQSSCFEEIPLVIEIYDDYR